MLRYHICAYFPAARLKTAPLAHQMAACFCLKAEIDPRPLGRWAEVGNALLRTRALWQLKLFPKVPDSVNTLRGRAVRP